ncbi:MAG: hypothetical protein V3T05_14620 [Myxococcota bacterium]
MAELAAAAAGDVVEIPVGSLNGTLEASRADAGARLFGKLESGGGSVRTREGVFAPPVGSGGVLRFRQTGVEVGETLEVEFVDLLLEPQWTMLRPEVLRLNGTVTVLPPNSALFCNAAAERERTVLPAEWTVSALFGLIIPSESGLSCGAATDCGATAGATCSAGECVFPEYASDALDDVGTLFPGVELPPFLNASALADLAAVLELMGE